MNKKELVPMVPPQKKRDIARSAYDSLRNIFGYPQNSLQPGAYARLFENGGLSNIGIGYGVEDLLPNEKGHYDPTKNEIILSEWTYWMLLEDNLEARLVLAHEIGHAVLHGPLLGKGLGADKQIKLCRRDCLPRAFDPEWQADVFAEEFVMPSRMIRDCMKEGYSHSRLAKLFHVSQGKIAARCKNFKSKE